MKTEIIFENENILVIYKPAGLATQSSKIGEKDVVSELKNYLKGGYVGLIHRLDQPVEGLLVFAKNKECAAELSRQVAEKAVENGSVNGAEKDAETGSGFIKEYLAAVCGIPDSKKGRLENYIVKKDAGTAEIVSEDTPNAKKAVLDYEVIKSVDTDAGKISLFKIKLGTGRFHQIRVQLAKMGTPILGDRKYGNGESLAVSAALPVKNVALCAERISFINPAQRKKDKKVNSKGEMMEFCHEPEGDVFKLFREE